MGRKKFNLTPYLEDENAAETMKPAEERTAERTAPEKEEKARTEEAVPVKEEKAETVPAAAEARSESPLKKGTAAAGEKKESAAKKKAETNTRTQAPRKAAKEKKETPAESGERIDYMVGVNEPMTVYTMVMLKPSVSEKLKKMKRDQEIKSVNAAINELLDQFLYEQSQIKDGKPVMSANRPAPFKAERNENGEVVKRTVTRPTRTETMSVRQGIKLRPSVYEEMKKLKAENRIRSLNAVINDLLDELLMS